jgi:bifunctional DNase/RNase
MADFDGSELELVVESVRVHVPTNRHVLLLKEVAGDRLLPVWIGPWEAGAIALWLQGERPERPLTHDLLAAAITRLGARAERVVITRLDRDTFYARLDLVFADGRVELDARPSDAIALAVRMDIPVYAAAGVLDKAASTFSLDAVDAAGDDDEDSGEETGPAPAAAPTAAGRAPLPAPEREKTSEPIDASRLLIFRDFVNSIDDPERRGNS